jgi:hypothetical protein
LFTNRQNSLCMWPANTRRPSHKIINSRSTESMTA